MSGRRGKPAGRVLAQVELEFRDESAIAHVDDPVREDLSASARLGDSLFLSCDETAGIDRLTPVKDGWGDHVHFNLGDYFDLPAGPKGEMDIEGLEIDGNLLWITGSHSLKREKPEAGDSPTEALERMEEIERDPNRYFLGCLPLKEVTPGIWEPARKANGGEARSLKLKKKKSRLLKWLGEDEILGAFMTTPSKENGIDIEGIAVRGERVWLGLRGPAIRGHAVIVELALKVTGGGHLKARKIDGDRRYRKYLLPSQGLGVRDLLLDGEDMLVLLGPVMSADGPSRVLRWSRATSDACSSMIRDDRLSIACELPYLGQYDHPEGLACWPEEGEDRYLVVYDAPAPERLKKKRRILADVMAFAR